MGGTIVPQEEGLVRAETQRRREEKGFHAKAQRREESLPWTSVSSIRRGPGSREAPVIDCCRARFPNAFAP